MSYKIAVATSDGVQIDGHFGGVTNFQIIQVKDDGSYQWSEKRLVPDFATEENDSSKKQVRSVGFSGCGRGEKGCGEGSGSGGCRGGHSDARIDARIAVIEDCRAMLCAKCGPGAERQLQRKAITIFAIEMTVEQAMAKIIPYYQRLDGHISLRKR